MKQYRYFAGMANTQANWLNSQAQKGWRLIHTGKLSYEFESCTPGAYQYCVEYVGHMSLTESMEYKTFLEEMGYRVWYKNLNLQWSAGKVQYRPWANPGGRIATSGTTIDKELLIVEKENDGTPFVLHTTYEDRIRLARQHRDPWFMLLLIFLVCGLVLQHPAFYILAAVSLIPVIAFHLEYCDLCKQSEIEE